MSIIITKLQISKWSELYCISLHGKFSSPVDEAFIPEEAREALTIEPDVEIVVIVPDSFQDGDVALSLSV